MRILPHSGPKALVAVCAAILGLAGCSLSLEDPEDDARKKLAKLVDPSWELLEGRWLGDSTYTLFDTQAEALAGRLSMDFFPDGSFQVVDSSRTLFAGRKIGTASLTADTLRLEAAAGTAGAGAAGADTFAVRMRFLGNWLELDRASDRRSAHFHKVKPFDSLIQAALLDSGLWLRRFRRVLVDSGRAETLRRDFDYLDFRGDSLRRDSRREGISTVMAGPLAAAGRLWNWTPGGVPATLQVDLFHRDSLRFWTYAGGRPDSGYSVYARAAGRHPLDLDMTPYIGHARADSIRVDLATTESHYGRFYDLAFGADHTARTFTNMAGMPRFESWSIDSGSLFLQGPAAPKTRVTVTAAGPKGLRLAADAGAAFLRPTVLTLTLVDGARFPEHPLERFATANYLHLAVGPDTLAYYFQGASARGTLEEYEISRIDSTDTLWAAWRLNPGAETFGSGQPSFFFAFQARSAALGRFVCRGAAGLDLAIRTTASADPALANGLVQGTCKVISADQPPADSTLAVTGEFRMRKRILGLRSSLWNLP